MFNLRVKIKVKIHRWLKDPEIWRNFPGEPDHFRLRSGQSSESTEGSSKTNVSKTKERIPLFYQNWISFAYLLVLDDPEVTANIYCKSRNLPKTDTQNESIDLR